MRKRASLRMNATAHVLFTWIEGYYNERRGLRL